MSGNVIDIIINMIKKGTGDTQAKSGLQGLSGAFKDLTGFSLGTATALGAVGLALRKGIQFTKDSIAETVEYNKSIREMTQVTGLGAEEISRIVQVGDDWGISLETLRTSLAFMNKSGVTPSIDALAELADEYVSTADKSEFAEKAVTLLGRGYQTLIPLLALGGDGFRDATAAIDDNLIATQDAIDASREYEVAMEDWNDSIEGVQRDLANGLIPTLADLMNTVTGNTGVQGELRQAVEDGILTQVQYNRMLGAYRLGIITADEVTKNLTGSVESLDKGERDLIGATKDATNATDDLTEATKNFDIEAILAEQAVNDEKQALSDMEWVISQPLTKSIEDFNEAQGDIQTEMGKVQSEINELNGMEYLTDDQQSELDDLKQEQVNLQTEYDNNATEHEAATQRILFDLMVEKLGVEGLLTSGVFEDMAEAWGLTADAEINAMIKADEATNWLRDHPGDVEGMKAILEGQASSWGLARTEALLARDAAGAYRDVLNSLDGKSVNVDIITHHWNIEEDTTPPRASGGPVTGGQPYLVGELGPEVYVPPQSGYIIPNNQVTNNFNMNVHTNAKSSTLTSDFNFMKQMAG